MTHHLLNIINEPRYIDKSYLRDAGVGGSYQLGSAPYGTL